MEFKDTWQSYLNEHRDDLQSFININLDTFLDANPSFVDGWAQTFFRDRSDTFSTFTRTIQTTTHTTMFLPNWHDIISPGNWMNAVNHFENMGWQNANDQYYLGPFGWDRDDEIQLGADLCTDGNEEPDYPYYPLKINLKTFKDSTAVIKSLAKKSKNKSFLSVKKMMLKSFLISLHEFFSTLTTPRKSFRWFLSSIRARRMMLELITPSP